jgi:hypothetical protein
VFSWRDWGKSRKTSVRFEAGTCWIQARTVTARVTCSIYSYKTRYWLQDISSAIWSKLFFCIAVYDKRRRQQHADFRVIGRFRVAKRTGHQSHLSVTELILSWPGGGGVVTYWWRYGATRVDRKSVSGATRISSGATLASASMVSASLLLRTTGA